MRPMAVLVSLLTLIAAAVGVAWLGQAPTTEDSKSVEPPKAPEGDFPQPRAMGPHPKAVVPEEEYDFGVMQHMEKGSHVFKVKNEGTVPLKLKVGRTTCQCTVGKLGEETIAPGGDTEIELNWQIKAKMPQFHHDATIHSDDPQKTTFQLGVKGLVGIPVLNLPEQLNFNAMTEGVQAHGLVYVASSVHDSFKITQVEPSSESVTAVIEDVTQQQLDTFKGLLLEKIPITGVNPENLKKLVKKVYAVRVTATSKHQQGAFAESITVKTDIPDSEPLVIPIRGDNPGAFQFFPILGMRWYSKNMTCDLGEIDGTLGKKASVKVVARGQVEPLTFTVKEVSPSILNVRVIPDPMVKSSCKLEFEVPPGASGLFKTPDDPATVLLESNHPQTKFLTLNLLFEVK